MHLMALLPHPGRSVLPKVGLGCSLTLMGQLAPSSSTANLEEGDVLVGYFANNDTS